MTDDIPGKPMVWVGVLLLFVSVVTILIFIVGVAEYADYNDAESDFQPNNNTTVVCYKYVENGTAHVNCPDRVQAPGWINITIKHCSEYEYANDEPHPCEPWRDE